MTSKASKPQPRPFVSGGIMNSDGSGKSLSIITPPLNAEKPSEVTSIPVITSQPSMPKPIPVETMEAESGETEEVDENGKKKFPFKKFFANRKKPSIRAKEKRIRQNRRLRKVLIPKCALMALNEVKGIKITDFIVKNRPEGGFTAEVSVNNIQYEGFGISKLAAKNNACEKALRDHIIFKMLQKPAKIEKPTTEGESQQSTDIEMKESIENSETEDDVPMVNLASFALFKLFSEWESEGFDIPEFRSYTIGGGSSGTGGAASQPAPIKRELPPNWETMHPTTLLCMMRPGIVYSTLSSEGVPPNTVQRVGVEVDGQSFVGEARSRKLARKNAAVTACNQLFGTNFNRGVE